MMSLIRQRIIDETKFIKDIKYIRVIDTILDDLTTLEIEQKRIRKLRDVRAERKFITPSRHFYRVNGIGSISRDTIGGVRQTNNFFLNLQETKNMATWKDSKKPQTDEKHYGLEIELFTEKRFDDIAKKASELRLKKYLAIGSDGSIRPNKSSEQGYELRLCIPKSELEIVLAKVSVLLNDIEAKVNKSCGLHVHFDMRNVSNDKIEEIYQNIKLGMPLLKKSIDPLRLKNTYCRFSMSTNARMARMAGSRYRAINMRALQRYSTIEVRAFQGTTDTNLIYNFIAMMDKIMETKSPFKRAPSSFKTLEKLYGKQVVDFVKQQENKYKQVA